jgi:hypothetical protein
MESRVEQRAERTVIASKFEGLEQPTTPGCGVMTTGEAPEVNTTAIALIDSLDSLASVIAQEHAYIRTVTKTLEVDAFSHALIAGHALRQAKSQLAHGKWLPWLKSIRGRLSERTATDYMLVADYQDEISSAADLKTMTLRKALEIARTHRKLKRREEKRVEFATRPDHEHCDIRHQSLQELLPTLKGAIDCLLTDPPYGKAHLPLYEDLARLGRQALKPDGVVVVMVANADVADVLRVMTPHLKFTTICHYVMGGNRHSQLWPSKMNCLSKTLLVFGTVKKFGPDTFFSEDVGDSKDYHVWGQKTDDVKQFVARFSEPDDLVCDPFLGGGATAVACRLLDRRFVGCDSDPDAVATTLGRLAEMDAAAA